MEERMGGATEDADIVNLHEMESNLVYFDTSLRANRMAVDRLTRYSGIRQMCIRDRSRGFRMGKVVLKYVTVRLLP